MKIRSIFEDASGQVTTEDVLTPSKEGEQQLEDVWLKALYEMMYDALRRGDDIEIYVKRKPQKPMYIM